jgi:hypothetical protein
MSEVKSASAKKNEDWMNSKWRPMMGWLYMATCTFDFVIFPILWSLLQSTLGHPVTQWNPLTLQGAGLYHIAMGAVLGLAAFGRTQEKLAGANNGGIQPPATGFGATSGSFGSPAASPTPSSFGGSTGFGAATSATPVTPLAVKKPVSSKPMDDGDMPPRD